MTCFKKYDLGLVFGSHLRVKLGGYIFVPGGDAVCVSPVVTVGATARSEG